MVKENLEQAKRGRPDQQRGRAAWCRGLPLWFAAIKDRGYEKGDQPDLRASRRDGLRTVVVAADGQVFIDRFDPGAEPGHVVIGQLLHPEERFREPLLIAVREP